MSALAVLDTADTTRTAHANGADAWWLQVEEILDQIRLPFTVTTAETIDEDAGILLVPTARALTAAQASALHAWTRAGGVLVVIGDPGHLADAIGSAAIAEVPDGHVRVSANAIWEHPPRTALHAVGGVSLRVERPSQTLATWDDGSTAIARRTLGSGLLVHVGVDLWQTVVRIQQGYRVEEDGAPAADGTAPIDDGILKAEDGLALSFDRDRSLPPDQPALAEDFAHSYPPPQAVPVFDEPHADHWRVLLYQLLWWAARERDLPLPWLFHWPADVPAIAHMSHDADQNHPEDARAALDAFAEADVHVTWCQVHPGGYGPEIHAAITAAGHENALHYNAMGDSDLASWGWPQMRAQYTWAQAVTGVEEIVSNKNHYTRWEGWTEFYTWCERLGIEIDESRGPSKQGSIGFPFGTAHVTFPMGDVATGGRRMDVLNLPLHTQDLAWASHASVRDVILDGALGRHGVAHFLFHGPHLRTRPATRAACPAVAEEARRRGMRWWTASRINRWERARRGVDLSAGRRGDTLHLRAHSAQALGEVEILLPIGPDDTAERYALEGSGRLDVARRHGTRFLRLVTDLSPGTHAWSVSATEARTTVHPLVQHH